MLSSALDTQQASWRLIGQLGDDESTRQIIVSDSPFTVGRRPDQSLTIPSPTISGQHAELLLCDGDLVVRDNGSTNGTFVNGVRISEECRLNNGDLVQFAHVVLRVGQQRVASHSATVHNDSADRALALIQFDKLMSERAVVPHFQPIVTMDRKTIGYEVLARSRLYGLSDPKTMFMAAAVLDLEAELSRVFRVEGIKAGRPLPGHQLLFVNTHPAEIEELDALEFSLRELRELAPTRPLVLEIHEGTVTRSQDMRELRATLRDLNMGLAYDDFGAGQARLVELVDVPPDYLKFDINLIRGIGTATPERQRMLESFVRITQDLGIVALAEGVEEEADHEVCRQMGFACAQGYLYGRPAALRKLSPSDSAPSEGAAEGSNQES